MPDSDKLLSVSVVLPVFNEQAVLDECLIALTNQTQKPIQIIVVNNNSTDSTADVAKKYPVSVIFEEKVGVKYARRAGYDAASGDIIASVDADTVVKNDWIQNIANEFKNHPKIVALAGTSAVKELSPKGQYWFKSLSKLFRAWHQHRLNVRPMLYGHNSAFRRSAWQTIKQQLYQGDKETSEDLEISILANHAGKVIISKKVIVSCWYSRSWQFKKLLGYVQSDTDTLAIYKERGLFPH